MRIGTRGTALTVLLGAALLVTGRTGSGDGPSPSTPSSPATGEETTGGEQPSADPRSAEEIEAAVFAVAEEPAVVAEQSGSVPDASQRDVPAVVQVHSVHAGAESARLEFGLATQAPEEISVYLAAFNFFRPLTMDIRDVAIEESSTSVRYLPFLGVADGESADDGSFCVCSDVPKTFDGDGVVLYATFAALDPATSTVTVDVPVFEPMTDVPVTRD